MSVEAVTALAALVTGVGSCLMGWAAVASSKRQADEDCERRLHYIRIEAESAADELHQLRMKRAAGE